MTQVARSYDYLAGNYIARHSDYRGLMTQPTQTVGDLLRDWRARRRFSQLALACEAEVSTRHLSFVESGRSSPSRDMLLRLAEPLALPPRERNRLLLAAGFAPLHGERSLDHTELSAARVAVERVLQAHHPFPALAIDRHWNLVMANDAARALLNNIDPALLGPPANVLRISLHPVGLAPRIINYAEWRDHLLTRLLADADRSGDAALLELHGELNALPGKGRCHTPTVDGRIAVPLMIREPRSDAVLSLVSTTTVFGTAVDVTLSELMLECFYPADEETRQALMT
jgi:transcriptional regulator with XRE-family HTH domain